MTKLRPHETIQNIETGRSGLAQYIYDLFESFKVSRRPWEHIWEESWRNYLGEYQTSTTWRKKTEGTEGRSRVFIKLTTLKCNTAHSKLMDLFPSDGSVPFDGRAVNPDELMALGISREQIEDAVQAMKNRIRDHLKKIEFSETVSSAALELCVLGTAVLKGPVLEFRKETKIHPRTVSGIPISRLDPTQNPYQVATVFSSTATIDHVPLWEYYTDLNAQKTEEAIGEIHFRRMLPMHFKKMALSAGHDPARVRIAMQYATTSDQDDMRYIQLSDNYTGEEGIKDQRVSSLEWWGLTPAHLLREEGIDVPKEIDDEESVEAKVCLAANGVITHAALNTSGRRPFFVCPYKKLLHTIYGMGVAWQMNDSQRMVNSAARLMIDNKLLSGSGMVAINPGRLDMKRTRDATIHPFKTWWVKGNFNPREAIDSVSFPDVTMGLRELLELFVRFSDEETGLPKYTSGEQDSFLNKTATGMSMLMGQANLNIKMIIKNIDDYWIEPIIEMIYQWFMETDEDQSAKIPIVFRAMGVESLVAKEIKVEQYLRFMDLSGRNPGDAVLVDRVKAWRTIARSMDTEDIVRSKEEIDAIMAEAAERSRQDSSVRTSIDIDRLYPYLTRQEQLQILERIGISPDTQQEMPMLGPDALKVAQREEESRRKAAQKTLDTIVKAAKIERQTTGPQALRQGGL